MASWYRYLAHGSSDPVIGRVEEPSVTVEPSVGALDVVARLEVVTDVLEDEVEPLVLLVVEGSVELVVLDEVEVVDASDVVVVASVLVVVGSVDVVVASVVVVVASVVVVWHFHGYLLHLS